MPTARWRDPDGRSLEQCAIHVGDEGIVVDSVVIADTFAIRYRLACDAGWRTRAVDVDLIGSTHGIHLVADGAGTWWQAGVALPQLAGAVDVDITATPFTNTLPIRRLNLQTGESKDLTVTYVTVPEMTVTIAPQRYTRLSDRSYRFESLDSAFTQDLTVDEQGLVVHYPTLFVRLD